MWNPIWYQIPIMRLVMMRNEGPRARSGQDRGTTSGCLPESRNIISNITGKLRLHLNFHASLRVLVEFNLSAGAPANGTIAIEQFVEWKLLQIPRLFRELCKGPKALGGGKLQVAALLNHFRRMLGSKNKVVLGFRLRLEIEVRNILKNKRTSVELMVQVYDHC